MYLTNPTVPNSSIPHLVTSLGHIRNILSFKMYLFNYPICRHRNYSTVNHTRSRSSPATCYSQASLRQHAPADLGVPDFQMQHQQQQQPQQHHIRNWNQDQQSGLIDHVSAKIHQQVILRINIHLFNLYCKYSPTLNGIQ